MSGNISKSSRVITNAIYGLSTWMIPMLLSFAATPVIVRSLGDGGYGIYALILGVIGYSFNFNTGRAVTKYVAEFSAAGEQHRVRSVINTTLGLNLLIGGIGSLGLILAAPWLVNDVLRIGPALAGDAVRGLYVAALIAFMTLVWQVFMSAIQGFQRFSLFSKLTNAMNLFTLGGNLLLAFLGFGLIFLLVWNAAVLFLVGAATVFAVRRLLPPNHPETVAAPPMFAKVMRFSAGIVGYQILANAVYLFERGWIIRKVGESELTYYVVPMTLGIFVHGFVSSFLLVLFPLSSEIGDDRKTLLRMYLHATKFVTVTVAFAALILIAESRTILGLWIGPEFADRSAIILGIHAISFSVAALLVVTWNMVEGLGHPIYNFTVFGACFVIAIIGMVFAADTYGLSGIALARMTGFLTLLASIAYVEHWVFGKIQFGFWVRSIVFVGGGLIAAFGALRICEYSLGVGYWQFAAASAAAAAAYGIVLFATGLIGEVELAIFKRFLRRG